MFGLLKQSRTSGTPEPDSSQGQARTITAAEVSARIEWAAARRLDGILQGDYRTLFKGAGIMLADLREYQPRDDVRFIDWNVTARMATPYIRETQEDRELAAWFVLDLSASTRFGSQQVTKLMLAAQAVATLGHIILRRSNRAGAIIDHGDLAGKPMVLPCRTGKRHLLMLLDKILRTPPVRTATDPENLKRLVATASRVIRRRSSVFVISDFYSEPGWEKSLSELASRHDVVAIRIVDPMEKNLPDMGMLTVQDPETGEQLFLDTTDATFRTRFEQTALAHENHLLETFQQVGVDCIELSTDASVDTALLGFIRARKQFLRQSAGAVHA